MTKEEIEKNAKDYASEHKIYVVMIIAHMTVQ